MGAYNRLLVPELPSNHIICTYDCLRKHLQKYKSTLYEIKPSRAELIMKAVNLMLKWSQRRTVSQIDCLHLSRWLIFLCEDIYHAAHQSLVLFRLICPAQCVHCSATNTDLFSLLLKELALFMFIFWISYSSVF